MAKPVLYPSRRALEDAAAVPGVRPLRLFPVLWPLWQIEISASVHDPQAFEVLDHFLVRALAEGRLSTVDEIAAFFSLPAALIHRCLGFLTAIGHLHITGERLALTSLGLASWRAGVRYVVKESRQHLMFERFTGWPFPRRYYDGKIAVLPTPAVPEDRAPGRTRFHPLSTVAPLRPDAVEALAARPDRAEFNVPAALGPIRELGTHQAFLPCYLIETAEHGVFAYTAVSDARDPFFAEILRQVDSAHQLIEAEDRTDPYTLWTAWLARFTHGTGTPRQTPSGMWRIILPPSSFGAGKLEMYRLGSYELSKNHIAQLWCEDSATRRTAALDRALALTRRPGLTRPALHDQAARIAHTLEVPPPTDHDLRTHARAAGPQLLGRLDLLPDTDD
ncbi:conserved hypothetical protein [Frankia sp. AiPs1]|uniref:hypothetical protein n=1 Tax=Frankia sp. AiPa1 TaxID=573492 RepID=UPI00202AF507|nr:hypothetical protein [Frankia sp. AiPa1]MCL9760943.1 hypothetical protein [Frankia sp. AiPa1]